MGKSCRNNQRLFSGEMIKIIKINIIFLILISLFMTCLSSCIHDQKYKLFFDLSTEGFFGLDSYGPAGFSNFKNDAENLGYIVSDTGHERASFGEINLSGLNVINRTDTIFIINPKRKLENAELDSLEKHVRMGGGLVVIIDSRESIFFANWILARYDMNFEKTLLRDVKLYLNESLVLGNAIPLNYKNNSDENVIRLEGNALYCKDLLSQVDCDGSNRSFLASRKASDGRVIALGSSVPFMNSRYNDSQGLVHFLLKLLNN